MGIVSEFQILFCGSWHKWKFSIRLSTDMQDGVKSLVCECILHHAYPSSVTSSVSSFFTCVIIRELILHLCHCPLAHRLFASWFATELVGKWERGRGLNPTCVKENKNSNQCMCWKVGINQVSTPPIHEEGVPSTYKGRSINIKCIYWSDSLYRTQLDQQRH